MKEVFCMSNFNIKEIQKEKFYQLPKVFFTNPKYTNLSNDAKITWSILRDRLDLSIRNNWIDKNGDIFFIYTNEKLKSILNISNPNKLYIKRPEVTEADIYYISKRENNIEDRYNKEAGTLCPRLNYCYPMKLLKLIHYFKIVFNFIITLITLLFRSCRIIFDFLFFKYLM